MTSHPTVHMYRFRGTFDAPSEFDYSFPARGATHEGLVFVRQDAELRDDAAARAACLRYGFTGVEILEAGTIAPKALELPEGRGYAPYVRWAFAQGAALAWFPGGDAGA